MATSEYTKPVPVPDEWSAPFFEATKRGEVELLRCNACGYWMWPTSHAGAMPVHPRCHNCFSADLAWAPASGRGTVFSYAIMHQRYPGFADDVPYNIVLVELEEGVRCLSNVVDIAPEDVEIGLPLEAVFEDINDEVALIKFRVAR